VKLILTAENITKKYVREGFLGTKLGEVEALKGVSFKIAEGEILGVVGESGSGKSTMAKILCGLEKASSGRIFWHNSEKKSVHSAQMVFQNPFNSLNPKLSIGYALKEAVARGNNTSIKKVDISEVLKLIDGVGLSGIDVSRYPHQFSGGQKQRIAIARSLALRPDILVCDEPVSALDISVQAQIINLLKDINRQLGLSIIFIAHDIEAVSLIAQNIIVVRRGKIVEKGNAEEVIFNPKHSYTKKLIEAVPVNPWLK